MQNLGGKQSVLWAQINVEPRSTGDTNKKNQLQGEIIFKAAQNSLRA